MCTETGAASRYAGGGGDGAVAATKELPRHCIALLDAAASDREEGQRQLVPTPPPRPLAVLMPDEHLRETEEAMIRPVVNGFAELQRTIQASALSQSSMHRYGQLIIQGGGFLQRDGHFVERPEVPDGAVCGPTLHRIGSAVSKGATTGIRQLGGVLKGIGKLAQAASYAMENPVARKLVSPRQPPARLGCSFEVTVFCFQAVEGLDEALGDAKELYVGLLATECQALQEIRQAALAQLDAMQVPLIADEVAPVIAACSDLKEAEAALRADDPARALSATMAANADVHEALRTLPADSAVRPVLEGMANKLDDSCDKQDWLCWSKRILMAAGCVAVCATAVVVVAMGAGLAVGTAVACVASAVVADAAVATSVGAGCAVVTGVATCVGVVGASVDVFDAKIAAIMSD
jgi:hypothetical protein